MKRYFIFIILFYSGAPFALPELEIMRVIDGDTVIGRSNNSEIKIRLSEIDAPELDQVFGLASKECLSDLIRKTNNLKFKSNGKDRYGRSLGWLVTNDKNLNYEMVKQGCAWVYDRYVMDKEIYSLQNGARLKKIGLWKRDDPIAPWLWRRNN